MSLASGARLGPYEVLAPLGAGGMGEVYRARDPRLGREVAIKVLPAGLSSDPERLRRFEQEARAAAALNHSNILAVHDVGQHEGAPYIVSELLDGDTLRERLATGPLPVRKAVEYAVRLARGLAAAHEKGITHRDLKPENIFITSDGGVKILDFGLAKLTQPEAAAAGVSALPTTSPKTAAGTLLGTAGYMSPEQMRGLPADQRSDIFAFGAVLYEMLSGARAFRGDTFADTITAILKEDPPDLPVGDRHIPPALVRIVDRCLEKSPSVRFQSAGDLGFALEELSSQADTIAIPHPAWAGIARERIAWTLFVVALVAALVLGALTYVGRSPSDAPVLRATILPPPGVVITERSVAQGGAPGRRLGISPDGQRLAFTAAGRDGVIRLWVRRLDSLKAQELDGTDGATYPFWSPDSKWLAFFSEGRGRIRSRLMKIDPSGGSPTTLCDLPGPVTNGGTWSRDDVILFALGTGSTEGRIHRVSAAGGTPSPITKLDAASGEAKHYTPHFLPDGRRFLYLAVGVPKDDASIFNVKGLYVGSLDSDDRTLLMSSGSIAKFANGHLLFMRGSTLMAQRFDPVSLKLGDQAIPIAEDVLFGGPTGMAGAFTVSDNGTLAYQTGALLSSQLTWFDRDGKRLGVVGDAGLYGDLALAPDGSRVAVTTGFNASSETNSDIWVYDVARGARTRVTSEPSAERFPVWSPNSEQIAFGSNRRDVSDVYVKRSSGEGPEELLFSGNQAEAPASWSRDNRFLALMSTGGPNATLGQATGDISVLTLIGDRTPTTFLRTQFVETEPRFSPDGRWMAYVSNQAGRAEVYVAPFPGPGLSQPISTAGGTQPQWRRDGSEIFYLATRRLMVAAIRAQGTKLEVGSSRPLFAVAVPIGYGNAYDVTADGQRFLVNSLIEEASTTPVTLVVNWPALLKK